MKKAVFSKKSTTTTDVVVQGKKPQKGPVALDLADLKQVSGGAIEEHTRNQELTTLNARLRSEVDDLIEESQRLESSTEQRWLLIGGALVLSGLLAGAAIKARPRRSGWS